MPIEKLLRYEEMSDMGKDMYHAMYRGFYGKEIEKILLTRDGYPITNEMIQSYKDEYELRKLVKDVNKLDLSAKEKINQIELKLNRRGL